ncbi:hypothetical protein DFH06DRAFT_1125386 [Mycena polygramma]|nr:hypothetical protein DFH06DRAFT_1125386 [Mycena polygramma]
MSGERRERDGNGEWGMGKRRRTVARKRARQRSKEGKGKKGGEPAEGKTRSEASKDGQGMRCSRKEDKKTHPHKVHLRWATKTTRRPAASACEERVVGCFSPVLVEQRVLGESRVTLARKPQEGRGRKKSTDVVLIPLADGTSAVGGNRTLYIHHNRTELVGIGTIIVLHLPHVPLRSRPYQFCLMQTLMRQHTLPPLTPRFRSWVEVLLDSVTANMADVWGDDQEHWMDEIFQSILFYCGPTGNQGPMPALPWGVIQYINNRRSQHAMLHTSRILLDWAWNSLSATIHNPPSGPVPVAPAPDVFMIRRPKPSNVGRDRALNSRKADLAASLKAIWRMLGHLEVNTTGLMSRIDVSSLDGALQAAVSNTSRFLTPSVVARLVRTALVEQILYLLSETSSEDLILLSKSSVYPPETSFLEQIDHAPVNVGVVQSNYSNYLRRLIKHRCNETRIQTLASFIESCCSGKLPFQTEDTLVSIDKQWPDSTIEPTHQLRFASAVQKLVDATREHSNCTPILERVIHVKVLDFFNLGLWPESDTVAWLDNTEAREILKTAFSTYLTRSASSGNPMALTRAQSIVSNLDAMKLGEHKGSEGECSTSGVQSTHLIVPSDCDSPVPSFSSSTRSRNA